MAFRETIAKRPEPTKEPIPEKKKKSPMMALCMDLGAAEYANSRPATKSINTCEYEKSILVLRFCVNLVLYNNCIYFGKITLKKMKGRADLFLEVTIDVFFSFSFVFSP